MHRTTGMPAPVVPYPVELLTTEPELSHVTGASSQVVVYAAPSCQLLEGRLATAISKVL